jgi:hypothetical protein
LAQGLKTRGYEQGPSTLALPQNGVYWFLVIHAAAVLFLRFFEIQNCCGFGRGVTYGESLQSS